jgi:hypothetical protein
MSKTEVEVPGLDWFDGRVNALVAGYKDRQDLFNKTDQAIHADWHLPEQLVKTGWVFKQVEIIFRQVVAAAQRILADSRPRITLVPSKTTQPMLNRVDAQEKALEWLLSAASRRREATIVEDIVESAIKYSEVTHEVVFMKEQIKNVKAAGGNPNRYQAMERRGPFAIVTHHPGSVFPRYSDMGVEEVASEEIVDPHDVVDLYGDAARQVRDYLQEHQGQLVQCTLRTYHSYDYKAVWVRMGPPTSGGGQPGVAGQHVLPIPSAGGEVFEIAREKWQWPFLPWVARLGGSSLETRSDFKRRTLLSDAVYTNSFDTLSRVKSLRFSEMVRYAGAEKQVFKSPNRLEPDSSSQSAAPRVHIEEDEDLATLQPPLPDPGMGLLYQELRGEVQKSTLSEVLFGGNVPVGAAFATINLVTHSAMAVLKEPRRLSQYAIADTLELMLLWAHYTKTNLVGYGKDESGKRQEYLIKWKDIDPANLYIEVDLTADVPTDRQARMLAATQGVTAGILSRARAREEVGIHNASEEEEAILRERIVDTLQSIDLQNEQFMGSLEAQQKMRQQFMDELMKNPEMLMQMMQQAMPQGGAGGEEVPQGQVTQPPNGQGGSPVPEETPGMGGGMAVPGAEMMGGAGGAGGMATREEMTGETQGGEMVA